MYEWLWANHEWRQNNTWNSGSKDIDQTVVIAGWGIILFRCYELIYFTYIYYFTGQKSGELNGLELEG